MGILLFVVFGVYVLYSLLLDIVILLIVGIFGYFMCWYGYFVVLLVVGMIFGLMVEE